MIVYIVFIGDEFIYDMWLSFDSIVSGRTITRNENSFFYPTSFIYKTTNEDMHEYQKFLEKRKKVLTVISSSEQILIKLLKVLVI